MDKKVLIPKHLSKTMRKFYKTIATEFGLEAHHLTLLKLACESADAAEQARLGIADLGLMIKDRFGQWKLNPLTGVRRDSTLQFARLIREMGLEVDDPSESRMPQIQRQRGLKIG